MIGRSTDWMLALVGGGLLALMIDFNSLLAKHTTPTVASWVAHGTGAVAAFAVAAVYARWTRPGAEAGKAEPKKKLPLWLYLGGVPGAFTVVLAAITVNGPLALSGSIALSLVGQVLFGIVSDYFGLFGTTRRRIVATDLVVALSVLGGSALIIFGGA
jgi:transporter family-2 protein